MSYSIKKVVDAESMLSYCSANLGWNTGGFEFDDIDEVTYNFTASDLGLQEDAFARINELRQIRPFVDNQPFGIFLVSFEDKSLNVSSLRRILQRLSPSRHGRDYKTWETDKILFFCFWGTKDRRSIGFAAFEDLADGSLPIFNLIYCTPKIEDPINLEEFERKLSLLKWPANIHDSDLWVKNWRQAFNVRCREVIKETKRLVSELVRIANQIKLCLSESFRCESETGCLHQTWRQFRGVLGDVYDKDQFADMFAQAIVYGLLSARCMNRKEAFTFQSALASIPSTNPLLKDLLSEFFRSEGFSVIDQSTINELISVLASADVTKIVADFNRQSSMGKMLEDPIVCFYEQFIENYNAGTRKAMGEYFTPFPAADFMVRSIETLLKSEFGVPSGFADNRVSVLDPGSGTATCLRDVIMRAHGEFLRMHSQANWGDFVEKSLLPRISGFELMMAPYAIAHLKLFLALQETGCVPSDKTRVNIYLKNALRPYSECVQTVDDKSKMFEILSSEARLAEEGNAYQIPTLVGGPPFREDSWNKESWIQELLGSYKKEPGTNDRINEQNLRPLSNDYVKFIRYAQERIKERESAIVAFLLPHTFIDNLTFRGMRWSLLSDFSRIYILDLHGNALGQGRMEDQNIFDIQQGVCVSIFIKCKKPSGKLSEVYYADVVGSREDKFDFLRTKCISEIKWQRLNPSEPSYFMSPRGMATKASHFEWINLQELFPKSMVGIKTHNDAELISTKAFDTPYDQLYAYRPFDTRHINYDRKKVERDRFEIMQHFLGYRNLGVVIDRQVMADNWSHFQVVEHMIDNRLHLSRKGNPYLCPIYLFDASGRKKLNLDRALVTKFEQATGLSFSEQETSQSDKFDVLDLVDYAYAILYCNVYRKRFNEMLSLDYPRIPLPPSRMAFRSFIEQGRKLRELHAYRTRVPNDLGIAFFGDLGCEFKCSRWKDQKGYIGKDAYLYPIPESVWNYCFGGYHGMLKWLKDRSGWMSTKDDINHLINVFNIFARSIEISRFIDTLAIEHFNGFEDSSVAVSLTMTKTLTQSDEYTIAPNRDVWQEAAHKPTHGFTTE